MSLYGLVRPAQTKCESANWRWVRANQLAPQGLGPVMYTQNMCSYGEFAPYKSPKVLDAMAAAVPYRVAGYPTTVCGRMGCHKGATRSLKP